MVTLICLNASVLYVLVGFGCARLVRANVAPRHYVWSNWGGDVGDLVVTTFFWPVVMPFWLMAWAHRKMGA